MEWKPDHEHARSAIAVDFLVCFPAGGGGGGAGGLLNKVLYGEAPPRGPNPYPLTDTIFDRKGTPFIYLYGATFTKLMKPLLKNTWLNQPLGASVWVILIWKSILIYKWQFSRPFSIL